MLHIIVHRVPRRTKRTLFAVRIVRNNVNTGNTRLLVHRQVVIGYLTTLFVREVRAEAHRLGSLPHHLNHLRCIVQRNPLLIETSTLTAHHIEQYAEACRIALLMQIARPVLSAQCPGVSVAAACFHPLRCAPVFSVEADEVNTHVRADCIVQQSCYLQHHAHTRCAVVGSHHRCFVVSFVRIVISPWSAVPVCTEHDALFGLRLKAGNNVGCLEWCTVVALQCGFLRGHRHAQLSKLTGYPLSTAFVGLAVHRAWSEVALLLTVE